MLDKVEGIDDRWTIRAEASERPTGPSKPGILTPSAAVERKISRERRRERNIAITEAIRADLR